MGNLPSYKNPPVNEVVCGMRFKTTEQPRIPYIGLLWGKFKDKYPNVQHASPLALRAGQLLIDSATGTPIPRIWFINDAGDELFQFQGDGFYFNWRRRKDVYPRFSHIMPQFLYFYDVIEEFYKEFQLGEIEPIEYELTYINHILVGSGWESIDDLPKVFSRLNWEQEENQFLPYPSDIAWNATFLLPEEKGRLAVNLKKGTLAENKMPVLLFEFKTIGIDSPENLKKWFELAHEWIIKGFTDLTTPEMHTLWEREDNV